MPPPPNRFSSKGTQTTFRGGTTNFRVFRVAPPANVPGLNFENFENGGGPTIFRVFRVAPPANWPEPGGTTLKTLKMAVAPPFPEFSELRPRPMCRHGWSIRKSNHHPRPPSWSIRKSRHSGMACMVVALGADIKKKAGMLTPLDIRQCTFRGAVGGRPL